MVTMYGEVILCLCKQQHARNQCKEVYLKLIEWLMHKILNFNTVVLITVFLRYKWLKISHIIAPNAE